MKSSLFAALAAAAIGIGTAGVWFATDLGREYDQTLGERISRIYAGATLQAWREVGPTAHAFQWQLFHDPEFPGVGFAYANHPPIVLLWQYAAERLFGAGDHTMRWAAVAYTALALVFLALYAGLLRLHLWLALGFFASAGAFLIHADLACPPLFGLPPSVLLVLAYARWRTGGGRSTQGVIFAATAWAALSDWNAWGMIGAVSFDLLRTGLPFSQRFRLLWRVAVIALLCLCLHIGTAFIAMGAFDGFQLAIDRVLAVLEGGSIANGGHFWILQQYAEQALSAYGWPLLILAAAGLCASPLIREEPARLTARLATLGGLIALIVLRSRAVHHPFWIAVATPGVVLCAALIPLFALERLKGPWRLLCVGFVIFLAAGSAWTGYGIACKDQQSSPPPHDAEIGRRFDATFGPSDLLIGFEAPECSIRSSMRVTLSCCMPADAVSFDALLDLYGNERLEQLDRIILVLRGGVEAVVATPAIEFIQTLPVRRETLLRIEGPVPYDAIELDKAEILARRRAKGLK